MGPGDKSLANLPVTQLLAPVTREPQRPQRGKQQNGGRFISCAKKVISYWGKGTQAATLRPKAGLYYRSSFKMSVRQASQCPEIRQKYTGK